MKNLNEEIVRIKKMMGVITETESSVENITMGNVSEGKRCWYYKKMAEDDYVKDSRIPNPYEGAGSVQDFLILIGHKIKKDWSFGNETAKALGTWKYGGKSGIDTVNKLWLRLKKDGYDVGDTTGYGPKMLNAVASMIIITCRKLAKTCKVDDQTLFDMNFKLLPEEDIQAKKVLIPNTLDVSFKYAVNYWKKYLNTPSVQQKIYNNMSTIDYILNMGITTLIKEYMNALDIIEKNGWVDYTKQAQEVDATMYVGGGCPKYTVCVNMDYYFKMYKNYGIKRVAEKTEDTFVHEIQHILWGRVQKLNSTSTIQQAFPSAFDYYYGEEKNITNKSTSESIPTDTKNELVGKGIDIDKLKKYFSDEEWASGYNCDWNEKLSNLSGYRSYLTDNGVIKLGGDIPLDVISNHIKDIITHVNVPIDFERMIACWVLGGMKPKLSMFVKELNDLAKNEDNVNGDEINLA